MVTRMATREHTSLDVLRRRALPLVGAADDYDALLDRVGEARFVLIGEASHGTHEFYRERAQISKRLITEKAFNAVAVEADWPDAYQVNRYVRGVGDGATATEALAGFKRFPAWMWRNADVLDFVGWLREHNDRQADEAKAGFYGLDLYSLYTSIEQVLAYLERVDPEAAKRARFRYSCFEHFGADPQSYGYAASFALDQSCEQAVVNQLIEMERQAAARAQTDGRMGEDEAFYAEQNARLVKNAEQYYRSMFAGHIESWNLRDQHMAETLRRLDAHLSRHGQQAKVVVWEHNSHLGDARATDMGEQGEWNVGQLVRERYGDAAVLIGFSTHHGTVTAASDWGDPAERKRVRPALANSYEALFHQLDEPRFMLDLGDEHTLALLSERRLERAIGVIYRPETERISHYFYANLPQQFDVVLHFDETRAVEPLERSARWITGEPPETFPTGV